MEHIPIASVTAVCSLADFEVDLSTMESAFCNMMERLPTLPSAQRKKLLQCVHVLLINGARLHLSLRARQDPRESLFSSEELRRLVLNGGNSLAAEKMETRQQLAQLCHARLGAPQVRWIGSASHVVPPSHVKSSQVKSSQVTSSQVKSRQGKPSQLKSSQVKSNQVKSRQVKACPVLSS